MPRVRNIYQVESLYVGPAPSTGYFFVDENGVFNNDYTNTGYNFNLVKSLYRIQNVSYGFSNNYTEILHLGREGTLDKKNINAPTIDIGFNYLQNGVINELRCGLLCNYTQIYGTPSGAAYYSTNSGVNIISGLTTRTLTPGNNDIGYPQSYTDKRNLFVAIGPEGSDINQTTYARVHPNYKNLSIIGFGNCYLTNYTARASVGSFPTCGMGFVGENMVVYSSGSGILSPAVDYSTRTQITNKNLTIPADYQGASAITALRPGDISLNLTCFPAVTGINAIYGTGYSLNQHSDLYNLAFSYSDIKIQSYDITLPLGRTPLESINHKLPIDRTINFPVYVNTNITAIVGDTQTGSFVNYLNNNDDYNLSIQLKTPPGTNQQTYVQYDFLKSKLTSLNYTSQIGGQKAVNFSFATEIDPSNQGRSFFISGLLNVEALDVVSNSLLKEDGGFLLQENGDRITLTQYANII